MVLNRRVTLRCLTDDLDSGWENADHYRAVKDLRRLANQCLAHEAKKSLVARSLRNIPRLNTLAHPLLRHFEGSFGAGYDATSSESISGLTKPHWWKQKTQQWRGAATDHSMVGEDLVWLCAAGIRRAGDKSDFYTKFMRDVERTGPKPYLPAEEDSLLGEIDEKITAQDAWRTQIHSSALALLAEVREDPGETRSFQFHAASRKSISAGSSEKPIGEICLAVDAVNMEGTELCEVFLVAKVLDSSQLLQVDVACQYARAALQSDAEEWKATPYTENAFAFSALIDPAALVHAAALVREGELPEESRPEGLRIGLRAHYARKHGIVDARVDGSPVLSLCGYVFVPTANHESLETCAECSQRHNQLKPGN
ncbi:MAG: DUF3039 domain-containing protein [Arthrobacter sp.]|uniref:DUF3039 domain-containing protein n=1 Tax=Arthrobacter sp. 179 TaxID=3457734 RepID=UPI00264B984F|nr:DUF3039 domain-containing protein [Micrococcaceae bacterium]MDN5812330.1 DUF3039 domain-containing protein [Micrococcaceae bacterium]MDN5878401.1 DUF3039 domain-containing protein [Micrococcaceae bacterium]MDN5887490.1 DUF3039 domain-containing protein [Micrococcaceae bacterium]MDN5905051.1 DUF3039 domain-containing protein [Micrococcaceae bacterium]